MSAVVYYLPDVPLAVAETDDDDLLLRGIERWEAREEVHSRVSRILDGWEHSKAKG
jgi:hypothetical protein